MRQVGLPCVTACIAMGLNIPAEFLHDNLHNPEQRLGKFLSVCVEGAAAHLNARNSEIFCHESHATS